MHTDRRVMDLTLPRMLQGTNAAISGSAIFQPGQLASLAGKGTDAKNSGVQVEELRARMERLWCIHDMCSSKGG